MILEKDRLFKAVPSYRCLSLMADYQKNTYLIAAAKFLVALHQHFGLLVARSRRNTHYIQSRGITNRYGQHGPV